MWERNRLVASGMYPDQWPTCNPRHVPWLGIKLLTFRLQDDAQLTKWATLMRAPLIHLVGNFMWAHEVYTFSLTAAWYFTLWIYHHLFNQSPLMDFLKSFTVTNGAAGNNFYTDLSQMHVWVCIYDKVLEELFHRR